MSNKLIEIAQEDWPALRDLYKEKKQFASSYFLIQNYISLKIKNSEENVRILSLNGDWKDDGTFILKHCFKKFTYTFVNTLSTNQERLLQALHCLDPNKELFLYGFQEHVKQTIDNYFKCFTMDTTSIYSGTNWFHLDKEKAEQFSIEAPTGIKLIKLEPRHAEKVNSIWPHRGPDSIDFVNYIIKNDICVGAEDESGELVAWCLRLPLGSLGLLQVVDSHKRLGLGSLMVRTLSHTLAKNNIEVMAPVVFENVASRSMFEKLGFRAIDKVYWAPRPTKQA
ncbi:uncharacterized protein LOC119688094 [Teleopsis dalmanni]|uniref:uncharacterized protein LOC119688094 n=1 Tax=Teleopsis dalmanni TaxID=139649 RepID=UPI0018CD6991|nr:uncharacterized protein LOC119688094 [Teleopsis dalmanni]